MEIKARIAITGRPGVGKTTLLRKVLERTPLSFGGMITEEVRKCGGRVGFSVVDLATGEEGVLAHLHRGKGPLLGRYRVNLDDLERVGIAAIRRAVTEKDLVVIDEIAPMELLSPAFVPAVEEALASSKALLVSTHAHADHPIAHRVRQELTLFRVKQSNRDLLTEEIARALGAA